jgi:alanyl-tRNA synthetase
MPADRPAVVVAVNDAGRAHGLAAGALVLTASAVLGGRGGGKDDIAQGGGAQLGREADPLIAASFDAVSAAIQDAMGSSGLP